MPQLHAVQDIPYCVKCIPRILHHFALMLGRGRMDMIDIW